MIIFIVSDAEKLLFSYVIVEVDVEVLKVSEMIWQK